MSYSDYGGYAYKNGERVVERSDFTLMPNGDSFGTPGVFPAFGAAAAGVGQEDLRKIMAAPHAHAFLGDGPLFVGLYKQTCLMIYRETPDGFEKVEVEDDPWSFGANDPREVRSEWTVDGVRIEAVRTNDDNYLQFVRVTQPDGTVWTGFSGYGVGAGLEDCGYGYSTQDCEERLSDLLGKRERAK